MMAVMSDELEKDLKAIIQSGSHPTIKFIKQIEAILREYSRTVSASGASCPCCGREANAPTLTL